MTTDLLSVWTDPDTAMQAVGTSLGIFGDHVSDARVVLPGDSPLRNALLDVLLVLVDDGELEKRVCADGRFAFRWRGDAAATAVSTEAESARLDSCLASMPREVPLALGPAPAPVGGGPPPASAAHPRYWPRLVATMAPLLIPALSCLLAILAFVLFGRAVALGAIAALALVGIVGLVRRVPLAGFWTIGVVLAGVLLRLS